MKKTMSPGQSAIHWIEKYCVYPSGPDRGEPVRLTHAEQHALRLLYDDPDHVQAEPLTGAPGSYVSLYNLCGPPGKAREASPPTNVDLFTTWAACGPTLLPHLKREGGRIVCPKLGTRYPVAA
jgi:hypothetical protein